MFSIKKMEEENQTEKAKVKEPSSFDPNQMTKSQQAFGEVITEKSDSVIRTEKPEIGKNVK